MLAAAKRAKMAAGTIASTPEEINRRIAEGFQFIAVGSDARLLTGAASELIRQIKR